MEKEHMIIIGLLVIILIMIVAIVWAFTNINLEKTTPITNTTNSSIAITNGSNNEPINNNPTAHTETNDDSSKDEKQTNDDKEYSEPSDTQDFNQVEEEYVEYNDYSSSSDGIYLSSDDYYVSDMGFVISKNPRVRY